VPSSVSPHPSPQTTNPTDKASLRRALRAVRNGVSTTERQRSRRALIRHALHHRLLVHGKRIGFYIPANAEIDILPLLMRAYAMGVRCFLPVVPARGQRKLWFSELKTRPPGGRKYDAHWRDNRFGIPEYHPPRRSFVRAGQLDRLLMPLLGFDHRGFRIGMGGGYYDASLGYRLRRQHWQVPRLFGVAFAAQEVAQIAADPWDIPLDAILTEAGFKPASKAPTQS
jgi:5-formyltetrahydrofolate cyclo-ligase